MTKAVEPNSSSPHTSCTHAAWRDMVNVLPLPAALVDQGGAVIHSNRWLDSPTGEALLEPPGQGAAKGLRLGCDGVSRWRVRPLDKEAALLLATAEREDVGDHLMRMFFSSGDSLFGVYDQAGRIIEANGAWSDVLGYSAQELFGLDTWTLLHSDDVVTRAAVEKDLREKGRSDPSWKMRAKDGTYHTLHWSLHFDASVGRCFAIGRDLSANDRRVDELHRRAYTDALTGLANRPQMVADIEQHLSKKLRPAVLFCDLDQFKVVNDSLGHAVGDELLAALGPRLKHVVGGAGCTIARFGGDEFVLLVPDANLASAEAKARDLLTALREPFIIGGRSIHVAMSIGIALSDPVQPGTAEQLLSQADQATYRAKERGRNRFVTFDHNLQRAVDRRFEIEQSLRQALKNEQFEVHYQPMVDLKDAHRIVGVEALLRWRQPDGSIVAPGYFLDVAIDAGLMPDIGAFVVEEAMSVAADLQLPQRGCFLSINTSAPELGRRHYVDNLIATARRFEIEPSMVVVEVTESTALGEEAPDLLARLRSSGFRIALDDFGTGYSSLAHLRRLPIDIVKIDRSFVLELQEDPVTRAMTGSLIDLCNVLSLDVILEGVETPEQCGEIQVLGGTSAQGYLFHRPLPVQELSDLLGVVGTSEPEHGLPSAC